MLLVVVAAVRCSLLMRLCWHRTRSTPVANTKGTLNLQTFFRKRYSEPLSGARYIQKGADRGSSEDGVRGPRPRDSEVGAKLRTPGPICLKLQTPKSYC